MIDNQKNYEIGYLDPYIFESINCGCLPLLPLEHKFFGNLFNKLVVSYAGDVNFIVESFEKVSYLIVDDIIDSIKKLYPEFIVENVGIIIKESLEKWNVMWV